MVRAPGSRSHTIAGSISARHGYIFVFVQVFVYGLVDLSTMPRRALKLSMLAAVGRYRLNRVCPYGS